MKQLFDAVMDLDRANELKWPADAYWPVPAF